MMDTVFNKVRGLHIPHPFVRSDRSRLFQSSDSSLSNSPRRSFSGSRDSVLQPDVPIAPRGRSLDEHRPSKRSFFHTNNAFSRSSSSNRSRSQHALKHNHGVLTCGFEDAEYETVDDGTTDQYNRPFHFKHEKNFDKLSLEYQQLQSSKKKAILKYYDVTVYMSDLENLRDEEWLNDNNLSFVFEYLEHTMLPKNGMSSSVCLLRPSMAYLLLHNADPKSLVGVLPALDTFEFIFLPINDNPDVTMEEGGTHWSLLVVSINDAKALYYDTLSYGLSQVAVRTASHLSKMLDTALDLIAVATPQQVNSSDCGILLCEITAFLIRRLILAEKGDTINLGLNGVSFVSSPGRTYISTLILQLINSGPKGSDNIVKIAGNPAEMPESI